MTKMPTLPAKRCAGCKRRLSVDRFYQKKNGRTWSLCKVCQNLKRYGITANDVKEMLRAQHGRCAICKCYFRKGFRPVVDHDHTSGLVRGVLCANCNTAIGFLDDRPHAADSLAAYLRTKGPHKVSRLKISKSTSGAKIQQHVPDLVLISIRLQKCDIDFAKAEAKRLAVPYQVLIRQWIAEKVGTLRG